LNGKPPLNLQREAQARLVPDIWEPLSWLVNHIWYSDQFGAFKYSARQGSETPCGLIFVCPGCGCIVYCSFDGLDKAPRWTWNGDRVAPHLRPSIVHDPAKGGCGWHGFLNHGNFQLQARD
jgi:hypothetical protein